MLAELFTFFKENGNGIMYIMLFFIVILFVFSYLNTPASGIHMNNNFIFSYGKNIIYSVFLIIILLFLFSLLGYNFSVSSSGNSSTSLIGLFKQTETYRFFSENGISIINVVIIFLMLIVMFSMLGINFNPIKNKTVQKVVEIESFTCNRSDLLENEKGCNTLSRPNCISTSCCGWLNEEKCVSSDTNHVYPNFLSDATGNKIKITSFLTNESS